MIAPDIGNITTMNKKTYSSLSTSSTASSDSANKESLHNHGSYLSSRLPREMITAVIIYMGGLYIPNLVIRPFFGINMRPIPYQILQNSKDVVLDFNLNQPLVEDVTVPSWSLHLGGFYTPLLILILVAYFAPKPMLNNRYHDIHSAACVLLTTIGMSEFITQVIKFYVGRLRPNFYALCGFDTASLTCTNPIEMELEGRCSFPSGHSSFSTSGMGVLVLFFLGRVGVMTSSGLANRKTKIKAFLALFPFSYSTFCASSRLYDNWHHPSDVVAGICLGLFCSTFVYHLWYAPVFSAQAGIPLSYLSALNGLKGFGQVNIDEEKV